MISLEYSSPQEHADLRWPLQTYRFGLGTGLRVLFRIDLKGYREFDREAGVTVGRAHE